ncbi:MAG: hypothetical protein MJZ79_05175 [Paludibacteraceae bacterium]|nr:hypothetical protein [Paludibacteraceae bacterium]
MKKLILSMAMVLSSLFAMSQMNQITWLNGRAVLGQPIAQIDSVKYGAMDGADTLHLLLPRTIIVHDTTLVYVHDTIIISTCDSIHVPEGLEMVDLGLPSGVKWANMNLGATAPQGYGDYFAWGETKPKAMYDWSTYFDTNDDGSTFIKYNNKGGKTTLDLEDDAAHVNWGGNWRMPTYAEFNELKDNCTWTWTTNYNDVGVSGYIVSSKTNSNSIFLPAAGSYSRSCLFNIGTASYYWTTEMDTYHGSSYAYYYALNAKYVDRNNNIRCPGYSIRPVCK